MAAARHTSRQAATPASPTTVKSTAHQSSRPLDDVSDVSDTDSDNDLRVSGSSNSRNRNMPLTDSHNSHSQTTTHQTADLQNLHNQTLSAKDREAQEEAARARQQAQSHHIDDDEDDEEDRLVPLASVPDSHRHNSSHYKPYSPGSPPQSRPFIDTHVRRQSSHAHSPAAQTSFAQETTPLLNHPPGPPPAYSPSENTYNTMPNHGPIYLPDNNNQGAQPNSQTPSNAPEYQQSLLPSHHREPSNHGNEFSFTWRRNAKDPRKSGKFRKWIAKTLKFILGIILLAALIGFIVNIVQGISEISRGEDKTNKPHLPKDTYINEPSFPDQLATRGCLAGDMTYKQETSFPEAQRFTFNQRVKPRDSFSRDRGDHVNVRGTIYVHESADGPPVYIKAQFLTTSGDLYRNAVLYKESDYFELQVPGETTNSSGHGHHCIYVRTDIYIRKHNQLDDVSINSDIFDIVFDGPKEMRTRTTTIKSISGDIVAWFPEAYESRSVTVETASGDIRGTYPLYDYLRLSSISGDVAVDVDLKNASDYSVKQATYHASSSSGHIRSNTLMTSTSSSSFDPSKDAIYFSVPDRNYISTFSTVSGDIDVQHLHGTDTKIETSSGDIKSTLIPYGDPKLRSLLRISNISGLTKSRVLSSLSHRNTTLDHWEANYSSSSGDLKLVHPAEWSGVLKAHTISGDMRVTWPGLEMRKIDAGKLLEGHKGDGKGRIDVGTISGDIDLRSPEHGDEYNWARETEKNELERAVRLANERERKEKENEKSVLLGSPWMDKWSASASLEAKME